MRNRFRDQEGQEFLCHTCAVADDDIEGKLLGPLGLCARIAASGEALGCEESERSTPITLRPVREHDVRRRMFWMASEDNFEKRGVADGEIFC